MKNLIYIFLVLIFTVSCEEIVGEENIDNETVILIAPSNQTILSNNTVTFSWESIIGATDYQLQIATPSFTNATQIVLDTIVTQLDFTKDLNASNYEWRLRAKNSAYETAYTTNSFSVNVSDNFEENVIILQNPADNLITNQTTQSLTWESIDGATDYRIQIWQPDTNGTLVNDEISTTNQKDISFTEGDFTWQVRAQNTTANTAYTLRSILVDTTIPNTPTLLTPTDNETLTDTDINFTWQRNALAGSTESDQIFIYSDVNLTTLVHENTVINNTYNFTLTTGNTYYWIMKSFDEAGNESIVSNTFSFTIN